MVINSEKQPLFGEGSIPYEFLSHILGGDPFTCTCTVVNNGLTLTTRTALVDTGASGYLFVNIVFVTMLI